MNFEQQQAFEREWSITWVETAAIIYERPSWYWVANVCATSAKQKYKCRVTRQQSNVGCERAHAIPDMLEYIVCLDMNTRSALTIKSFHIFTRKIRTRRARATSTMKNVSSFQRNEKYFARKCTDGTIVRRTKGKSGADSLECVINI